MTLNVNASASESTLSRALPWLLFPPVALFLSAVITGPGPLDRPGSTLDLVVQQEDKHDQNFYANAHPYLEEPLKKLVKHIPELKGLRPEANQQALPMILEMSGDRVDAFFRDVVDVLAHEEIAQNRLDRSGAIEASQLVQDSYLILRHGQETGANIDEYRMDNKGNRMDKVGLDKGLFVTSGFALSCNYFSTAFQPESRFLFLGNERIGQRDTYVVAFAQKPGKATLFVTMTERGGARVHMLMQGIMWADKSNFQIIRTRLDLLAPRPEIGLDQLTTVVTLNRVQLRNVITPLWLPKEVKVYVKFRHVDSDHGRLYEREYRNEHHYADYRRYRVSVKINPQQ